MPIDPRRAIADLKELRALTANEHGAQRIAWTPTWLKARAWFQARLAALPVEHHLDAAGNSWTTLKGKSETTLILGSHLDSVPNGGWLDGALGVLAAFEVLRALCEDYQGNPPITIRLVVGIWLILLTVILLSKDYWGWVLLTGAGAVANFGLAWLAYRRISA